MTTRRISSVLTATCILACLSLGCSDRSASDPTSTDSGPDTSEGSASIRVTCTTGMVADIVRNVGGDHVTVVQIMKENVDPHLYEPSPRDVSEFLKADIVFYSGLHLEGQLNEVLEKLTEKKTTAVAVLHKHEETKDDRLMEVEAGLYDPHVWFDLEIWSECVPVVAEELSKLSPDNAEEFNANAEKYAAEIRDALAYGKEKLATIPKENRVLVTAHDAFEYFGRAMNIEVRAVQGVSTESEAGVKEINELVDFIVERKVRAVFVETSVSERNIKSLIEGCKSRGHEVTTGEALYSDALGGPETPAATYIGMVRHNIDTIAAALGGEVNE